MQIFLEKELFYHSNDTRTSHLLKSGNIVLDMCLGVIPQMTTFQHIEKNCFYVSLSLF